MQKEVRALAIWSAHRQFEELAGFFVSLAMVLLIAATTFADEGLAVEKKDSSLFLSFKGNPEKLPSGATKSPKIVLISGDDEYRSEEALPVLAKILSEQHGMDCIVSFSINPENNSVDPNYHFNNPGLENLADADAMILFTRFREWPTDQMKHFEEYVERGGPIIALRTATHPFVFGSKSDSPYKDWSWDSKKWPGGFGQNIIGETWYSHHGKHKVESARAVIEPGQESNPILRGVSDVWAPSDVYGVVHLPKDAQVLMRGQVLSGMEPTDAAVTDGRNEPMMPLAWTKAYQYKDGREGKVFCSTMCSSVDLLNEGLRRLMVNATYWAVGLEDNIPDSASVELPADYKPTFFGFHNEPGYFSKQNKKPADYLPE
jgi:hypothetical protein